MLTQSAYAAIVALHEGSNDPETEGFTDSTPGGAPMTVDGEEVWTMEGSGLYSKNNSFSLLNGGTGPAGGWAARFRVKMENGGELIGQPDAITSNLRDGGCMDAGPGWASRANTCSPGDFTFYSWDDLEAQGLGDRNEFNTFQVVYDPNENAGEGGTTTFTINDQFLNSATRSQEFAGGAPTPGPDGHLVGFGWAGPGEGQDQSHFWQEFVLADSVDDFPVIVGAALPSDFSWSSDQSGDWNVRSNWNPIGKPGDPTSINFTNHSVTFGSVIQSNQTVFTNTGVSVRGITFDNSNTYAVGGTGSVSLVQGTDSMLPANSMIAVTQGAHQFQLNVELQNDTLVDVASDATLEFNNRLFFNGNSLTKTGAGEMAINNNVLTGGGTLNCAQGTCSGTGTISGDFNNDGGTVSPGNSPGIMAGGNASVPEPAGWLLLAMGVIACGGLPRRIARRRGR